MTDIYVGSKSAYLITTGTNLVRKERNLEALTLIHLTDPLCYASPRLINFYKEFLITVNSLNAVISTRTS